MESNILSIEAKDWSVIEGLQYDERLFCNDGPDNSSDKNLGIYIDSDNKYRTIGLVGICVLKNKDNTDFVDCNGKRIVLIVKPRFDIDQWTMLMSVMNDDEYDSYVSEKKGLLYNIHFDSGLIEISTSDYSGNELLAISYIRNCYSICSRMLKRDVVAKTENLHSKLKGRLDLPRHLYKNIFRGREDYVYCRYNEFSQDILLNMGMKVALQNAYAIVNSRKILNKDGFKRLGFMFTYCNKALQNVESKKFSYRHFRQIKLSGFDSVYRPIIDAAKKLLSNHYIKATQVKGNRIAVIPYSINMEKLFEFYARAIIKRHILDYKLCNQIRLTKYMAESSEWATTTNSDNCYLMKHYNADLAFQVYDKKNKNWKYVAVLDAKYQYSYGHVDPNVRRHNTHQLMFYMLMYNVKKCGFVFPKLSILDQYAEFKLNLQLGELNNIDRQYGQFYIGTSEHNDAMLKAMEQFVLL